MDLHIGRRHVGPNKWGGSASRLTLRSAAKVPSSPGKKAFQASTNGTHGDRDTVNTVTTPAIAYAKSTSSGKINDINFDADDLDGLVCGIQQKNVRPVTSSPSAVPTLDEGFAAVSLQSEEGEAALGASSAFLFADSPSIVLGMAAATMMQYL